MLTGPEIVVGITLRRRRDEIQGALQCLPDTAPTFLMLIDEDWPHLWYGAADDPSLLLIRSTNEMLDWHPGK